MFIYNTTFSIKETILDKGLKYIQTEYIPNLEDDGFRNAIILKIHTQQENDGYCNYAVQFIAPSKDFILSWKENTEKEYKQDILNMFGESMLTFSTIMESI